MEEVYTEQSKVILTKVVNGQIFTLELHAIPNDDYSKVESYDYIIAGPNWLSGYLKSQGYNERGIFEYFEQCTMQNINDDWDIHYEKRAIV